jgi:hypothetical protein
MLIIALALFACAAVLGLVLLSFVLSKKETPKAVAIVHGLFAVSGVTLLILYSLWYNPSPILSLGIFILAALGGLTLIYRDLTGRSLPSWMALGHGFVAVIGFITLAVFIFS